MSIQRRRREVVDRCKEALASNIVYEHLKVFLKEYQAYSSDVFDEIEFNNETKKLQTAALLDVLKTTDNGWDQLCAYLPEQHQQHLLNLLNKTFENMYSTTTVSKNDANAVSFSEMAETARLYCSLPVLHLLGFDDQRKRYKCRLAILRIRRQLVFDYTQNSVLSAVKLFDVSNEVFPEMPFDASYVDIPLIQQQMITSDDECAEQTWEKRPEVAGGNLFESSADRLISLLCDANSSRKPSPVTVLGDPGQGKTMFVRHLAYDWAMAQQGKKPNAFLENITFLFAFPLRHLQENKEKIVDFLLTQEVFPSYKDSRAGDILSWIRDHSKKTLIVLDGYDESSAKCSELSQIMETRNNPQYPDFPLVMTTRPDGISEHTYPWAYRFQMGKLTDVQVEQIVQKCCEKYPISITNKLTQFCKKDENSFLATSPLLIRLLCWAAVLPRQELDESTPLKIPGSETDTYFKIAEWITSERKKKHAGSKFWPETFTKKSWIETNIVSKFAQFAFWSLFGTEGVRDTFERYEINDSCGFEFTDEAIKCGYLIVDVPFYGPFKRLAPGDLKLSFAHVTFQEFFAAVHVVKRFEESGEEKSVVSSLIEDANNWSKHVKVIIFALAIAWHVTSTAAELLSNRILAEMLRLLRANIKIRQDYRESEMTMQIVKALFREANITGNDAMRKWANENQEDLDHFCYIFIENRFCTSTRSPMYTVIECVYRYCDFKEKILWSHSLSRGQNKYIYGCNFVFLISKTNNRIRVTQFNMPMRAISTATFDAEKARKVSAYQYTFHFAGTLGGLASLLDFFPIPITSNKTTLRIYNAPLQAPDLSEADSAILDSIFIDADSCKAWVKGSFVFNRLWLHLSSKVEAHKISSLFKNLSQSILDTLKPKRAQVRNLSQSMKPKRAQVRNLSQSMKPKRAQVSVTCFDERCIRENSVTEATEVQRHSEEFNEQPALNKCIRVNKLDLVWNRKGVFTPSAFSAIISNVAEVYFLRMDESATDLLTGLTRNKIEALCGRVRYIRYETRESPPVCLAKFVSKVNALSLTIDFVPNAAVAKEAFEAFCRTLAEESVRHPLLNVILRTGKAVSNVAQRKFRSERDVAQRKFRSERDDNDFGVKLSAAMAQPLAQLLAGCPSLDLAFRADLRAKPDLFADSLENVSSLAHNSAMLCHTLPCSHSADIECGIFDWLFG